MASSAERYRTDPVYRELQKKRVRVGYFRKQKEVRRPVAGALTTEYFARLTIENPDDVRVGRTVRVPVYRIGQFAELLGRSPQTIRLMIKSGRLPAPLFELDEGQRSSRAYTYDQMRVAWEYLPLLNFTDSRDSPPSRPNPLGFANGRHDPEYKRARRAWKAAMAEHRYDWNPFSRAMKEAWERMPDGVIVLHPASEMGEEVGGEPHTGGQAVKARP